MSDFEVTFDMDDDLEDELEEAESAKEAEASKHPHLKVVGEIKPKEKDDVTKLVRKAAKNLCSGEYGKLDSFVTVAVTDEGLHVFSGGEGMSTAAAVFLLQTTINVICQPDSLVLGE